MKLSTLLKQMLFASILFLALQACTKGDDNSPNTDDDVTTDDDGTGTDDDGMGNTVNLVEFVSENSDLSLLEAAVVQADLTTTLSGDGPFTLFAPTDLAFQSLLDELGDSFAAIADFDEAEELELLSDILKYHVVNGNIFSTDLNPGSVSTLLEGETIEVIADGNSFVLGDATELNADLIDVDNAVTNGVVHLIDKVLLTQDILNTVAQLLAPDLVQVVTDRAELNLLEEAVVKAGLVNTLSGEGPYTLFAPTDSAIQDLFDLLGDQFNSFDDFDEAIEILLLKQIIEYHLVNQNLFSNDLNAGTLETLASGETIEIIASGDTFVIGDASDTDANILTENVAASNGVVHIIDKILVPQAAQDLIDDLNAVSGSTIKELVTETEELQLLEEALRLTGLLDTLGEEGPFTIFAPSDDVLLLLIALIGEDNLETLADFDSEFEINLLRQVLLYHVLPQELSSSELMPGTLNTLLEGSAIQVNDSEGSITLEDALPLEVDLLTTDIEASNGIIHFIDRILVPQTVIDQAAEETEDNLIELISLLEEQEIAIEALLLIWEELQEEVTETEFTFFLPSNQAFLEGFERLGVTSLNDFDTEEEIALLLEILSYHFVENQTNLASELGDGLALVTRQGENIEVVVMNGKIQLKDKTDELSSVTQADQDVLSGVVHMIDKLLLPQSVLDQLN